MSPTDGAPAGPDRASSRAGWPSSGSSPASACERDGIASWDLDARRPAPLRHPDDRDPRPGPRAASSGSTTRRRSATGSGASYRRLLRWNDEFPFAKFALAEDERPVLTAELPVERLDRDLLGLAVARLLGICDQLLDESAEWIWLDGKVPPPGDRISRQQALLDRYAGHLAELLA